VACTYWFVGNSFSLVGEFWVLSFVAVNSVFHISSEVTYKSLNWPSSCITKSANSVALNLVGELLKHVDLSEIGISKLHSLKHVYHPAGTLSAWGALSTTLMLVELGKSQNSVNNISLIIHNNDCSSSQSTSSVFQIIEVHEGLITLLFGKHWN